MAFKRALSRTELAIGEMKSVKVSGKDLLIANLDGTFYAISNSCPHAHAPLSRGKLNGCTVTCPLHKADFDVTTGRNLSDAKVLFFKMKAKDAPSFVVKLEDGEVFVDI